MSGVLLHPEGIDLHLLSEAEKERGRALGLSAIDCVWKRLDPLLRSLPEPQPVKARIPDGFVTAYPRVAKDQRDPEGGFATIEALFIGAAFLGHTDYSLLREYYFAEEFLKRNDEAFRRYGITLSYETPIYRPLLPRNSETRRISRGRRLRS